MEGTGASVPGPVRRLRVRWREGRPTLDQETRVESMTLPPSRELPRAARQVIGSWFELRDSGGELVYRGDCPDPRRRRVEVRGEDGAFTNVEVPGEVDFEILVPDLPEGGDVAFLARDADRGQATRSVPELAVLSLAPHES